MRRERDAAKPPAQGDAEDASSAPLSRVAIEHPSRHFVPYTGRYCIHFVLRGAKGVAGHNLRLLLHSNGLCVVTLDPTHILVESHVTLLRSIAAPRCATRLVCLLCGRIF